MQNADRTHTHIQTQAAGHLWTNGPSPEPHLQEVPASILAKCAPSAQVHIGLKVCARSKWSTDKKSGTCGLVAMTSASHAEGRQFDPGQVYSWYLLFVKDISLFARSELMHYFQELIAPLPMFLTWGKCRNAGNPKVVGSIPHRLRSPALRVESNGLLPERHDAGR